MDFVARLIQLLDAHPRDRWESVIRTELRGAHYVASTTGRHEIRQLRDLGLAERTARWKVRGY